MLCKARHRDGKIPLDTPSGKVSIKLNRGQFVFGRHKAEEALGLDGSMIYRKMQKMIIDGMIAVDANNRFSVITICNYDTYQSFDSYNEQQANSNRTAGEQQSNTNNKVNNVDNVSKEEISAEKTAVEVDLFGNTDVQTQKSRKPPPRKFRTTPPTDPTVRYIWTHKKRVMFDKRLETFETFWEKFNYKHGKAEAADSWLEIPLLNNEICRQIFAAAEKENLRRPQLIAQNKTPKWAQGWISGRRWEDEVYQETPQKNKLNTPEEW